MVLRLSLTTRRLPLSAAAGVLAAALLAPQLGAQAPTGIAPLIDRVMAAAASLPGGTYRVTEDAIEPDSDSRPLVVQADLLRGAGQTIRAAFMIGTETSQSYEARLRVIPASTAADASRTAGEARGSGQPGRTRLVRELTLDPGEYEVHGAIAYPRPGAGATVTLIKERLMVPDLWRGTLAVTPVVIGDAVTTSPGRSAAPFVFEPTLLTPAISDSMAQSRTLHVAFRVYNWTPDPNEQPDLAVEYVFYERTARGRRFFNKMKPQRVNATVLGSALDISDGAVTAGASVPLASFSHGAFQLIVRVTDNRSRQTVERTASFAVVP